MEKQRLILLVIAVPLLVSAHGVAKIHDWRYIGVDVDGVPVYYDDRTVKSLSKGKVSVLTNTAYDEMETPVQGKEDYGYCRRQVEVDCLQGRYRVREADLYGRDGGPLAKECPFPAQWLDVATDLVMLELHGKVCGHRAIETMPPLK